MPIPGHKPLHLVSEKYQYRALKYSATYEYGTGLHCSQYQSFAAALSSNTPREINEGLIII